jgi:hypothetical protein
MEPLVQDGALDEFAGAPFPASVVSSAAASVRREVGWHIAPAVQQTLKLDSIGGTLLVLPTLELVSVESVKDRSGKELVGWLDTQEANLFRAKGWPAGPGSVVVALTSGYETCPPDILPVLAERCQSANEANRVQTEASGGESITYFQSVSPEIDARLYPYKLVGRP